MALKITKSDLNKAHDRLQGLRARVQRVKKQAEEVTVKLVRTAEVGGAAFGMGVLRGKMDNPHLAKLPIDLLLGLGSNVAGYLNLAGKSSDHLNNLGDGALASYATHFGRNVGIAWKAKGSFTEALKGLDAKMILQGGDDEDGLSPAEIAHAAMMAHAAG